MTEARSKAAPRPASESQGPTEPQRGFSRPLLERLALYYQIASHAGEQGQDCISSAFLAELLGIDATLVRKDMAAAGITGRPKRGYSISHMLARLDKDLGLTERNAAILIGCGDLGSAIARYPGFTKYGLKIAALFDTDPAKIGRAVGEHSIQSMDQCKEFIERYHIEIAIVAAPAPVAQQTVDWLVSQGIRAIWNFAPVHLRVPPSVVVRNENLALGLAQLIHKLKFKKRSESTSGPSSESPGSSVESPHER